MWLVERFGTKGDGRWKEHSGHGVQPTAGGLIAQRQSEAPAVPCGKSLAHSPQPTGHRLLQAIDWRGGALPFLALLHQETSCQHVVISKLVMCGLVHGRSCFKLSRFGDRGPDIYSLDHAVCWYRLRTLATCLELSRGACDFSSRLDGNCLPLAHSLVTRERYG